jgi:hypothetical protein
MQDDKEKSNAILFQRIQTNYVALENEANRVKEFESIKKLLENQDREIQELKNILGRNIKNEEGKWPKVKEEFVDWSLNTNFDGYSKIFKAKIYWIKFVWLFLFLAFTSATAWLISYNIIGYLDYEVTSLIEVKTERPALFPSLTICNSNPFPSSKAKSLMDAVTSYHYNGITIDKITFSQAFSYSPNITELAKMLVNSPLFNQETRLSLEAISIIPSYCYFNNEDCKTSWGDLGKHFHKYFDYDYGNCYQFNVGLNISNQPVPFLKQTGEGSDFGLTVQIGPYVNFNKYMSSFYDGLVIFVHNQSSRPTSTSPIKIEIGKMTSIALKRTFTHNQASPYTDCQYLSSFQSTLFDLVKQSNYTYSQTDCFHLCLQRDIINTCGCYYTRYTQIYDTARPCLNLTELDCIQRISNAFEQDKCTSECPLECDSVKYEYSLSSMSYPSQSFYDKLKSDVNYLKSTESSFYGINLSTIENYKKYFLMVNVYYPYLEYTEITESPKFTLVDLISQTGGSLGMFCSFSLFHFIEIIEIIIIAVYILLKN